MLFSQIVTEKGFHLDIRLPSITSTMSVNRDRKSPSFKALLRHNTVLAGGSPKSPESGMS